MGDHEAGPAFHQRLQPLLDLDLGHRIYAAGRFVQHQHGRTRKDRPRDGEQLLLPLADAAAVNRQHPLVAALHPHNKRMGVGQLRRRLHFLVAGIQPAVADIVADCPLEQERILQHKRHMAAQALPADRRQVPAIQRNAALAGIVEAGQQPDQSGFACSGRSDQRDHLAGLSLKADILQCVSPAVI
ncbi:hypothetical protein D3C73_736010 [compost metagenome]